jgi:hypothetical protein
MQMPFKDSPFVLPLHAAIAIEALLRTALMAIINVILFHRAAIVRDRGHFIKMSANTGRLRLPWQLRPWQAQRLFV